MTKAIGIKVKKRRANTTSVRVNFRHTDAAFRYGGGFQGYGNFLLPDTLPRHCGSGTYRRERRAYSAQRVSLRFLDTAEYPYRARVLHCVEEPAIAMDDFNAEVAGAEHLTDDWLMEFSPAEETAEGIRLLGLPTDWPYAEEPPRVFMQFDPLASEMGFRDSIDGYCLLLFGRDDYDVRNISYTEERS